MNSLSFVKLVVDDLEAVARFYEQVFGMSRTARFQAESEMGPIDEIVLDSGEGARLIIVKWLERPAPPAGELMLGFRSTDIDQLFSEASAAAGTIVRAPSPSKEAGGLIVGLLADPEGHAIEIIEAPPQS